MASAADRLPAWQTVYWQFQQWEKRHGTERILDELRALGSRRPRIKQRFGRLTAGTVGRAA